MTSDEGSKPPDPQEALKFTRQVIINNLPYIFESVTPEFPSDFLWVVKVPNWEEQKQKAEEMVREGKIDNRWVESLKGLALGEGAVGSIRVSQVEPKDGAPSIGISRV